MYTNYVNLQCCRWPSVDCSFRIKRGRLKFERVSHVTLITAQPQPNIPLSLVIHLCLQSLTDKTMQNSKQLKSCTTSKQRNTIHSFNWQFPSEAEFGCFLKTVSIVSYLKWQRWGDKGGYTELELIFTKYNPINRQYMLNDDS